MGVKLRLRTNTNSNQPSLFTTSGSNSPVGPRRTTSAISDSGVGFGFASIRVPPFSLTIRGKLAAGKTVAEVPPHYHAVAHRRLSEAGVNHRRRYRLPKHHGIPFDQAAALRTQGRQALIVKRLARPSQFTADTPHFGTVAMNLHQPRRSRPNVEIIHVLRNRHLENVKDAP